MIKYKNSKPKPQKFYKRFLKQTTRGHQNVCANLKPTAHLPRVA